MGSEEVALAADVFDQLCSGNTLKSILGHFRHLCTLLHLQPTHFNQFYPKLKSKLRSWKAQALWNKFDKRASHKCYNRGKACSSTRVLVIGAGPCGLRSAIEAQLLGAKVVVIEKRDRLSRNNVLHLWPFVIHDLRGLGAKKFFGRFCAGAIDHISIRQLQCILLKVALILGVEIHEGVSFEDLLPPPDDQDKERIGWRAVVEPKDHPVSQYEFDVLIGADGKRNTLDGFKRKEFRGKLAIAITANFINRHSLAEARVEEISGVAFIFNQKFFKELYASTGIDLENIVYYKDETHYFVMTAKKHSLIDKGVILNDFAETARLLAAENVDKDALMEYAREAADFSTGYQLPQLEFALNHYGQPDVAMFDFTSMYAAENASRVVEKHGHRLLVILVGDSLLEPFWPTGSGCARGFLSSMDACWAVRNWAGGVHPLQVLAERESVYRLLGQTTPENLHRDLNSYTLDPHTRYPNLNTSAVLPVQVRSLMMTDDLASVEDFLKAPLLHQEAPKKRRKRGLDGEAVLCWVRRQTEGYPGVNVEGLNSLRDGLALCALIHHYRPPLLDFHSLDKENMAGNNQLAFDILERELSIPPVMTGEEMVGTEEPDKLTVISYLSQVYDAFRGEIPHVKHPKLDEGELLGETRNTSGGGSGRIQITHAQRHSLLSKLARTTRRSRKLDRESRGGGDDGRKGGVGKDLSGRVKDLEAKLRGQGQDKKPKDLLRAIGKIEKTDWNVKEIEKKIEESRLGKNNAKQKAEKVPKWSKEQFDDKFSAVEKKLKGRISGGGSENRYAEIDSNLEKLGRKRSGVEPGKVSAMAAHLATVHTEPPPLTLHKSSNGGVVMAVASEVCHFCGKRVYLMERLSAEGKFFHRGCFKCHYCSTTLRLGNYLYDREGRYGSRFFCMQHFGMDGGTSEGTVGGSGKRSRALSGSTGVGGKAESPVITTPPVLDEGDTTAPTPERVEFENLSDAVDLEEDEWTDTNFAASDSSDISESSSESEDGAFAEALEEGLNEETLRLARDWTRFYAPDSDDSPPQSYHESDEEESETATEGEEEVKARELRKKEVPKEIEKSPGHCSDTGSDTEVASDEFSTDSCSEESEPEENSATEISTDSEFEHDGTTHHIPDIIVTDVVQVKRGQLEQPKKVQLVTAHCLNGNIQKKINDTRPNSYESKQPDETKSITPLTERLLNNNNNNIERGRPSALDRKPIGLGLGKPESYLLNRTQSTEGIASKLSLELKKRYLLGPEGGGGSVRKSGSASTLDSKFKSLIDQISEQQKLLNPAPSPSPTMRAILEGADKIRSPPLALLKKELPNMGLDGFKHVCVLGQAKEEKKDINEVEKNEKKIEEEDYRPRSPVHETSIVVPELPRKEDKPLDEIESDSLSSSSSSNDEESGTESSEGEGDKKESNGEKGKREGNDSRGGGGGEVETPSIVPKLEIHNSKGELMEESEKEAEEYAKTPVEIKEERLGKVVSSGKISSDGITGWGGGMVALPTKESSILLKQVTTPAELFVSEEIESPLSSLRDEDSGSSHPGETAPLTETELSDWAREEDTMVSDTLDDLEIDPQYVTFRKHRVPRSKRPARGVGGGKGLKVNESNNSGGEDEAPPPHVCGKGMLEELERLEWADTGGEEETPPDDPPPNSGYVRFLNDSEDAPTPLLPTPPSLPPPDHPPPPLPPNLVSTAAVTDVAPPPPPRPTSGMDYHQSSKGEVSVESESFASQEKKESISFVRAGSTSSVPLQKPLALPPCPPKSLPAQLLVARPAENCSPEQVKLEKISKERAKQKDLIHEMVLSKVLSERESGSGGGSSGGGSFGSSGGGRRRRGGGGRSPLPTSASLSSIPPSPPTVPPPPETPQRPKSFIVENTLSPIRKRSCTVSNHAPLTGGKGGTGPVISLPDLTSPYLRNQFRESAKARLKMMSDEDLGLSPEEKLRKLREKLNLPTKIEFEKKKGGKEERKRSIIQAVQDFFKKSPSPPKTPSSQSPTKLFKFSRSKDKIGASGPNAVASELKTPPVPPLPQEYVPSLDESMSEEDSKGTTEEKSSKRQRRLAKQAQQKRLRMAQEMQRQLEELEVKQRELEAQGVELEKALRGEHMAGGGEKEHEELLQEWFELVRQRTDVRRYENELMVRAQELELDDRHSRLQQQLKALLSNNGGSVALEGRILREMLEIVERKSALSAQLESERQRYQEEDKDIEAQMLAKGLRLTPLRKSQ